MRKVLLLIFLILFSISFIVALDCQYTKKTQINLEGINFYNTEQIEEYNLNQILEINENKLSFTLTNNLDQKLKLKIIYNMKSSWFGEHSSEVEVEIGPYDSYVYKDKSYDSCVNHPCYLENIKIYVLDPKYISFNRCRLCGSQPCLDDGASCNPLFDDSRCGSGICNIAGFCGSEKIVDCPNGKLNCKDMACLETSTKGQGEAYDCPFECKSNRWDEEKCLRSSNEILVFWLFILIGFGGGSYLIFKSFYKRSWLKKEQKIMNKAKEKAENLVKGAQKALKKINHDLEEKKFQKSELKKELDYLKNKKRNSLKVKKELTRLNEEIKSLIEKERENKEKILREYKKSYGHDFVFENGYIRFKKGYNDPSKKGDFFHKWIFESANKRRVKKGYELHHIDFNKLNNSLENLEELTPEEHRKKHNERYNK